jgi:hypothetical protein
MLTQNNAYRLCVSIAVLIVTRCSFSVESETEAIKWEAMLDEKLHMTYQIQSPGGSAVKGESRVLFAKNFAIVMTYDPDARYGRNWDTFVVFDLEKMAWYEEKLGEWVDMKTCQNWEKASIERTKGSIEKIPDSATRNFIEASINPKLQTRKDQDGSLTISNDFLKYVIRPIEKPTPHQLVRFNAYDRLNAYHKAMHDRQLPPTAQIAVDDVLAKEKSVPKQLVTTIKTPNGEVVATLDLEMEAFEFTDGEFVQRSLATIKK